MLYTLAKFFVWGLGFALIGGVIGWLLRSIRCRRELLVAKRTTVDEMEVERLRHRVANLEPIIADRDALRSRIAELELELKAKPSGPAVEPAGSPLVQGFAGLTDGGQDAPVPVASFAGFGVAPDLDEAKAVFGKAVAQDDLKVVEGIGPVLEGVLHAGGVTTWAGLGATAPDAIRAILVGADDRHRMHDPTSWPRQARLAAIGEWDALKSLQDRLTAGRD